MTPALQPRVESTAFYRAPMICSQGPFELELPIGASKYGEAVELLVKAPRKIALHASIVGANGELTNANGVVDASGHTSGRPDNVRCIADAREQLAAARGGGTGGGGATVTVETGTAVRIPGAPTAAPIVLERIDGYVVQPTTLINFRIPDEARASGRIRIRFWSIEPNDLEGVAFGVTHIVWRPNVPEAEYEAYLVRIEQERVEAARRAAELAARMPPPEPIDPAEQRRRDEAAARRAEADARRAEENARRAEADARARAARAEADARAKAARDAFCAAHPDDRGCWGPGGLRIHLELEARRKERDAYCSANRHDARCFTAEDRRAIETVDSERIQAALTPVQPSGPPPAPLAETTPPKLSANAEWRPGYWHWIDGQWVWLAGTWRVPESDIVAEQTTTAPSAPPPVRAETPPPPPVTTVVWVPGFWQWDGATWIWISGSYQMRPTASLQWRPAAWQPRGRVHILVPGAWVRIGGGR